MANSGVTIEFDDKEFLAKLAVLKHAGIAGARTAEEDVGREVLRLSMFEVPHDKGSLQNSGAVDLFGGDVVVGFHMPYAARLHEHPEYHFQKGRKGKYLEDPIRRNKTVLGLDFGDSWIAKVNRAG